MRISAKTSTFVSWLLFLSFLLSGCEGLPAFDNSTQAPPSAPPSATATQAPLATATPLPSATPTDTPEPVYFLWTAPYVPQKIIDNLSLPPNFLPTERLATANYRLEVGTGNPASQWVFALVAPFPTIPDGISVSDLKDFWAGRKPGLFNNRPLLLDENTYQMIGLTWGPPAQGATTVLKPEELLAYAWGNQPSWAIIPFEALQPRWKVLEIDGVTPFDPSFDPKTYPLTVSLAVKAASSAKLPAEAQQIGMPASNLDESKMTRVALTGVTALVRGTAITMDAKGILYPAEETGALLRSADITHISNEIPFYSQCPKPVLYPSEIRFCSPPSYMALLEDVGMDVVELTGDHFGDYGIEAMQETLAIYKEKGIPYYGGGANSIEARQAVTFEHNGNHIAFIGCNAKGVAFYATASETYPGAVACDLDWMSSEIARLKAEGYLVIATFQHVEYDAYDPDPKLKADMQRVAAAGAVIVSGSQAHQPHGMTFLGDSFIHYGLGNLFFDQYRFYPGPELDRAFIDWHIFYDGRYISTRLISISWVDLAKNRLTTPLERADFLKIIFNASQWAVEEPKIP